MKKLIFSCAVAILMGTQLHVSAQSTFTQVHSLFQAKCTPACHSGASPSGNLDLTGSESQVYGRLVNATPVNPVAAGKGLKLVSPGYPLRSFLLKKVNHGLDPQNELTTGEGDNMPGTYGTWLSFEETELIRQWIIFGAPDTGVTYNLNLIHNYYTANGIPAITAPPTPAEEGKEGYQAKFGPIFVEPGGEFEFFQVFQPNLSADKEITKMVSKMAPTSHHWVLRTVDAAGETIFGNKLLDGNNLNSQLTVYQHTQYMGVWQFSGDITLPQGTALYQDQGEALLLNLHIPNYSNDSIIAATAYLNVYTQPRGSGAIEMHTSLATYGGMNPFSLNIPATGQPYTLQNNFTSPGETRYFWTIQAHSHSRGTDYDMFKRNANGTKGDQIYEGFFNEDYSFNQGYYDYAHPAVRRFEPLLEVDMDNGLIFEATWLNNTGANIPFGFTTKEEMFITYFQYTTELPTGTDVKQIDADETALTVYPNPGKDNFNLSYTLNDGGYAIVELYNATGQKVKNIFNGEQAAGKQQLSLDTSKDGLPSGIYFVRLSVDGKTTTKRMMTIN